MIRSGVSYGDRRKRCLQALAWWVIYLMLRGKIIDLNNFKTSILAYDIEEYQLDLGDTIDGKRELINCKELSHEKWDQWGDSIYNYFTSMKNSRGVTLSYATRKDTPSPENSENRYVQIIYKTSIVGNMSTRDSRKVLNILNEPTLGTDAETWIKGL